jgi:uncharacterized membrane protein
MQADVLGAALAGGAKGAVIGAIVGLLAFIALKIVRKKK